MPTAIAALHRARAALDEIEADMARMAAFEALAEAVMEYDRDGMSDEHRPEWARVVEMARNARGEP